MPHERNRYDVRELAGAFDDLGTLIPFLVGYVTINGMDPAGGDLGLGTAVAVVREPDLLAEIGRMSLRFRLLPSAILGLILFVGGLELAAGIRGGMPEKADRYVLILTAGLSMWNMGPGYAGGLALWSASQRGWLRA